MRIAMFGGSFDPIHFGHLILAENCREQAALDEVWFIPSATAPHKQQGAIANNRQRMAALHLALGGHTPFQASDIELNRDGVSFTVDTLEEIRQRRPQAELFFMIGGDSLNQFHSWREPEKICQLASPLVVARPGQGEIDFEKLAPFASPTQIQEIEKLKINCPLIEISSTNIRNRRANGKSIRFLTPRPVEKYIQTQKLYLEPNN